MQEPVGCRVRWGGAGGKDGARVAGTIEDLPREDEAEAAGAAGDQVDTGVVECDRRHVAADRDLLPIDHVADAVLVSDERLAAVFGSQDGHQTIPRRGGPRAN